MTPRQTRTFTHWGAYDITSEHGEITAVTPFAGDPDPSPIGQSLRSVRSARIARPSIRQSWLRDGPGAATDRRGTDPFVEVEWDRALDLLAAELRRVRDQHGNQAIFAGSYGWSSAGRFHHAQGQLHRFMNMAGGYTRSTNTYSLAAAEILLPHVIGWDWWTFERGQTSWSVIAENTEVLLCLGGVPLRNTQVQSGGIGRHRVAEQLERCHQRGVRFVNASPIRSDLTQGHVEWMPVRPGTDVALLLGLTFEVVAAGLHDEAFLHRYCEGWDRLHRYLSGDTDGVPKNAAWASAITGVPRERITELARSLATHRSLVTATWSLQRADHGEQTYWAVIALAAAIGQIGLPGGGFGFGYGSVGTIGNGYWKAPIPSLPQGAPAVDRFIPVARVTDMLLHPGATVDYNGQVLTYPDIKLVYWSGGNPFHHQMDLNKLQRAWAAPDTVVVQDPFWTATARRADIVLPATTPLERNDIGGAGADGDLFAMHRAVPPVGQARDDYDIFSDLAARLGFADEFTQGRTTDEWIRHLYAQLVDAVPGTYPPFSQFWDTGFVENPESRDLDGQIPQRTLLEDFRRDPDRHRLNTPSGLITLYSEAIDGFGYADCPPHPTWLEPYEWLSPSAPEGSLHLLSHQPAGKLHSQWDHGVASRERKINGREPIVMNPDDATARNLHDGQVVRVSNARGACYAALRVTDDVAAGVVTMATGAWYDPDDTGQFVGADGTPPCRHGNPNVLTCDRGTSRLAQGPTAQTCLVTVTAAVDPPEPRPFDPPRFVEQP